MGDIKELIARLEASAADVWHEESEYTEAVEVALLRRAAAALGDLEAENTRLRQAAKDVVDAWAWWRADQYDRCESVPADAIEDLKAAIAPVDKP